MNVMTTINLRYVLFVILYKQNQDKSG